MAQVVCGGGTCRRRHRAPVRRNDVAVARPESRRHRQRNPGRFHRLCVDGVVQQPIPLHPGQLHGLHPDRIRSRKIHQPSHVTRDGREELRLPSGPPRAPSSRPRRLVTSGQMTPSKDPPSRPAEAPDRGPRRPTVLLDCRWLTHGGAGRVTELLLAELRDRPPPSGTWLLWGGVSKASRWKTRFPPWPEWGPRMVKTDRESMPTIFLPYR